MVLKLNFKRNVWEEKKDLGGLTVFASFPSSFARAGLSTEQRNKICLSYRDKYGRYDVSYSVGDEKSSYPPPETVLSKSIVWVEPPHNYVNL
ncbi:predicted protein [Arabidopsis lyrata subsp. lyrata]|uniref:Predicted protein n=1 Tax=Arabidopsis lyrata subsp. lyrata TaxID=81972 RepID=D7MGY2_ARALL|nr:predicted protein [Arabidopsis lyrata subsp. lyrata]